MYEYINTPLLKFGVNKIFISYAQTLFDQKYSKNSNIVKYYNLCTLNY